MRKPFAEVADSIMTVTEAGAIDRPVGVSIDDAVHAVTTEEVAKTIAGIPQIGAACEALRRAGRRASIAGNRITVDDQVCAQLVGASTGRYGHSSASWTIYHVAGTPPAWIVGAEPLRSPAQ